MKCIKNTTLSRKVKETILDYIKNNEFEKNKLPREEVLSEKLGVSRLTVRTALNELSSEGFIFRKHGKGTFLNREALKSKAPLSPLKPFPAIINDLGYKCDINNFKYYFCKASDLIANCLNIDCGEEIIFISKTFCGNAEPLVHCEDYLHINNLEKIEKFAEIKNFSNSTFDFLREVCGKKIVWDKVEISTTTNLKDIKLNEIFNIKNGEFKEFLVIKGMNYDKFDIPTVYSIEYINSEKIPFSIIRQKIV